MAEQALAEINIQVNPFVTFITLSQGIIRSIPDYRDEAIHVSPYI